jgi:hypothetical protein
LKRAVRTEVQEALTNSANLIRTKRDPKLSPREQFALSGIINLFTPLRAKIEFLFFNSGAEWCWH